MTLKDRLDRAKNRVNHYLGLDNSSSTSDDRSKARSPGPMPRTGSCTGTPIPENQQDALLATISPQFLTPQTLVSSQNVKMTAASMLSAFPATTPATDGNVTSVGVQGPGKGANKVAWSGLKTLMNVLNSSANVFPPLSSAIDGASRGRKEYEEMYSKLDSLLGDLSVFIGGPAGSKMTMSMKNLCYGLNEELKVVQGKCARDGIRRDVEALEDAGEIMECYQRVHWHLERLALNANLGVWKAISSLEAEARLRTLSPMSMSARYNSAESEVIQRRPCTPGTREGEILKMMEWVDRTMANKAERVYWMSGMAGTGKTTIAYSLCARLEMSIKLGASFFCSRQIPECRNVKFIIPSIAYQLARFSHHFCCALIQVLELDPDVHTRGLKTQLDNLLVKPLMEVQHTLPADFIVVIDALDECENQDSVGHILDTILCSSSLLNLPIRFVLSSRPEPQIYSRMMSNTGDHDESRLVLHDLDEAKVRLDIETYLKAELEQIHLTHSQLTALVFHSGVLFIYASTAARYIKEGIPFGRHIKRLNMVLGLMPPSEDGMDRDIDALYASILQSAFESRHLDKSDRTLMKALLDVIICAQEPMTIGALSGLLGEASPEQVDGLLRPLCSVLNIVESSRLVNTLHESFPDFMRDHARSAGFHCDPPAVHTRIAQLAFKAMRESPFQFNICQLESSCFRDEEVLDLAKRADQNISTQLLYSCRHWEVHARLGGKEDETPELLYEFLSERLLLWMEVLNLKACMHLGPGIMRLAAGWISAGGFSKETTDLAHDAWRFVTMYTSHSVSQSTPHIYISMLPFWPESSPITKCYTRKIGKAIRARGSATTRRKLALLATWPMTGSVWSVCYSPDESLLACGVESSVYLIDGTTGRVVLGPLEHGDRVSSVAFSADGALVVSGSHDQCKVALYIIE